MEVVVVVAGAGFYRRVKVVVSPYNVGPTQVNLNVTIGVHVDVHPVAAVFVWTHHRCINAGVVVLISALYLVQCFLDSLFVNNTRERNAGVLLLEILKHLSKVFWIA